jgi:predicted chitinase
MSVFKVVNPGDTIDFFGCMAKVERVSERGSKTNEKGIRFLCLRKADIRACVGKINGYFMSAYKGSSLHPNERAQLNNGGSGCYKDWPQLAKQAFTSLSTECAKSTGTQIGFSLGCKSGADMANRCCPGSNNLATCETWKKQGGKGCAALRICKTIHGTGRASDSWGYTGETYCYPDPYDATNHQTGRAAAWFCWVKNAHRFKINNILNEYWHWEWHGHLETKDSKNPPEPAINSDGSINTDAQGDNSQVLDDTTDAPSESETTNFQFGGVDDALDGDWQDIPDSYGSLEGIEQVLSLDRFQTTDMFKGVVFLKDDENLLSNERFDNANSIQQFGSVPIIDGNTAYMTGIEEIWAQMPIDQNPKVIQAQEDLEKLRTKLGKLSLDSEERKKSLEELKVILTRITPESDLEMGGLEEDELVKLINKYKETGNPLATSLENILNDTRNKKSQPTQTTPSETNTSGGTGNTGTQETPVQKDTSSNTGTKWLEKFRTVVPGAVFPKLDVAVKGGIDTPLRMAHFIAQCKQESGNFVYKTELASGKAYEGRKDLGNTQPGDGPKFKGRGYIQITGRANYTSFDKTVPEDILANPELVATKYPMEASVFWWKMNNANKWADQGANIETVKRVSRLVNRGSALRDKAALHETERISFFQDVQNKVDLA